ncbi:MAG: hypothetical protein PHG85_05505 [Candidatus Altiarchaeota archaeon]|nr:hypothetical protein [Candidatus Altiarchaeota archaeon]
MGVIKIGGDEFRRHKKEAQAGQQEPVESTSPPDILKFKDAKAGQAPPKDAEAGMLMGALQDMLNQLGSGISLLDVEKVNVDLTGKGEVIKSLIGTEPNLMGRSEKVRVEREMDKWEPAQVTQILRDASEADIKAHPAYHTALWRQALINKQKEKPDTAPVVLQDPSQGLLLRLKLDPGELLKDPDKGKPKRPRK